MHSQKHLIQFWNQFETLTGSFGMLKCGSKTFYRSVYLTLYNGPERLQQQLKKQSIHLIEPRLSILAASHAERIIDMIEDEKISRSDGLISCFRIICSRPVYTRLLQLQEFKNLIKPDILFYIIKYLHLIEKNYTFSHESMQLLDNELHSYDNICIHTVAREQFIR